jgi:hypothetical protein
VHARRPCPRHWRPRASVRRLRKSLKRDTMTRMHVARVKNGRLTLDEPTDLPEGTQVPLEIADDWDDLDEEERAALHREIAASIAERKAGAPTYSVEDVLAELGSRE